jgi:signal transduction histidine kinase
LALIRTEAELTLRKTRTEAEYQGARQHILSEVERTSVLVADLLRVARTDSGVETFTLRLLDLGEIVQIVGERWASAANVRGLKFSVEVVGSDFAVLVDRDAIRRLLDTLLENAMKYTPSPGTVLLSLSSQANDVWVRVSDTGIGISEEDVPKIFDRFYRSDPARNRESGGTGLGLSIAKWIVERHGGTIEVCSSLGQGSTFTVALPTATQDAKQNNTLEPIDESPNLAR